MQEILIDTHNGYGVITLNRANALNALSLDMLQKISKKLDEWEVDPFVHTVLVRSAIDRAFCSGGDVKLAAQEANIARCNGVVSKFIGEFFRAEYSLNAKIAKFPKPYISFLNGIVMGGGAGISIHGSHRIANNTTKFAMPEAKIGFFSDVGSGAFLSKCSEYTGLYLAMTGKIISGDNMAKLGLATHFIEDMKVSDIFEDILEAKNIDDILKDFEINAEKYDQQDKIDKYFSQISAELILDAIAKDKDNDEWCLETYNSLINACPTSLKVIFKHFHLSKKLNHIEDIVKMDYRLSQNLSMRTDFYEGVRAVLIDKTNDAKWFPPSITEVKNSDVGIFFGPALNDEKDLF